MVSRSNYAARVENERIPCDLVMRERAKGVKRKDSTNGDNLGSIPRRASILDRTFNIPLGEKGQPSWLLCCHWA